MVKKYKSIKNWESKNFDTIIDVRSPSEFANDHIIGAINCPVLSDQEREKVGTIYKKESTFKAKIIGSSLTARNIADHIEKNFLEQKGSWQPLIYCWRGGQRSKAFSIILSEVGWRTYQLDGGYKEYRNSVVKFFENIGSKLKIILISGKTGSAKTKILQNIGELGGQILDLEGLANHKGSLLGKIPGLEQPSQKLFESKLFNKLKKLNLKKNIYVEAESSKIGNVYMCDNPDLIYPLLSGLRKRLSKKLIDSWEDLILKKNWEELTESFLQNHYDPSYSSNTIKNDRKIIKLINAKSLSHSEISKIAKKILKNN